MSFLANISIHRKLTLMQTTTAILGIIMCAITFVILDYKAMRENTAKSISSIARVIGTNTVAPLVFGDTEATYETLTDLQVETNITNASIIDTSGKVFAAYTRKGAGSFNFTHLPKTETLTVFENSNLFVYYKIHNKQEWLGTVCLKVDLSEIEEQLYQKIKFAIVIIIIGAFLAYLVAYFLQKYISRPIIDLVNVMENVMETNNFSLRSNFIGKDEIAKLSMAFNKMLGKIEKHDQTLSETNNELEIRVKDRTQELVEKNEKLIAAKAVAEQSKIVKEQFLASMSHEIRTPLNAILGFQELLKETPLSSEQKEYVESIDFAGKNLLVIINDILDLSKIEAGKFTFEEAGFTPEKIIRSVVELVEHRAQEKKLKINIQTDPTIPSYLVGDPSRLSQILLNLIGNAIKFTETGEVNISTKLIEESADKVYCKFTVQDSGIGIPSEKIKIIFERFTQASSDTTRKYGGTGLGLTIVQQLVELQGGKVEVESEVNKGSTFSFYLPFKKTTEVPVDDLLKDSDISNADANQQLYILLAEDIPLNQRLIQKIMQKWGYKLDVANNGAEALEFINKNNYDLILMDIQMPEVDGYTATKIIRAMTDPQKKNIPIVALTAHASNSEAERCINIGMNAYISKPFNSANLKKIILQVIGKITHKFDEPAKAAVSQNQPLYNLDYLIEHAEGDKDFIIEMITLFINDVPVALNKLREAINLKDYEGIKTFSHSMKGLFLTLGIQKTGDRIKEIEKAAERQASIDEIIPKFKVIEDAYQQAKEPLLDEIEKLKK